MVPKKVKRAVKKLEGKAALQRLFQHGGGIVVDNGSLEEIVEGGPSAVSDGHKSKARSSNGYDLYLIEGSNKSDKQKHSRQRNKGWTKTVSRGKTRSRMKHISKQTRRIYNRESKR
ncbi:MAG: hypothetical protein PVJ52_00465 [Candidatus Woesebacteria bacterium]|jgi:hypothetical protein